MSPDNPAVIHNDAVTTSNFRLERPSTGNKFASGPCAGQSFVNSLFDIIDRRTETRWRRGELTFVHDADRPNGGSWHFLPSYPKDDMEDLGPHHWSQAEVLELGELIGKLQPESI